MSTLFFHTIYEDNKPRCAIICKDGYEEIYELYRPGERKKIKLIRDTMTRIRDDILQANEDGYKIVTNHFKDSLLIYGLPLKDMNYNVYDIHSNSISELRSTNNKVKDHILLKKIIEKLQRLEIFEYQKLFANAAVVYQDLENKGLLVNGCLLKPKWSLKTFSGRSKSTEFNIQGHYYEDYVRTTDVGENIVLLHFDWIAADIRVASILSEDESLYESFSLSDPYTYMADRIADRSITRDDCKLFLLKSINSMSHNDALKDIFPGLHRWVRNAYEVTQDKDAYMETMLGRKFRVASAKNQLAVLNGVMQGTVAHAMHNAIRIIWDKFSNYLLADIHDSIVLSVPNDPLIIRSIIDMIIPIMLYPLDNKHCFPIRVSIGKKWKKYRLLETRRSPKNGQISTSSN